MLATLLPLLVATAAVYILGSKYYRESAGQIFQNRAQQMANYLSLSVDNHSDSLYDRIALAGFHERVEEINELRRQSPIDEVIDEIADIEGRWSDLSPESPEKRQIMENDLARDLLEFTRISPIFAEIFITDEVGRMVASTGKTTNYWHAFKPWWQTGMQQPFKEVYVEGVNYDESAEVYSFDIIIPIRNWREPDAPPAGVIKAVLNASPLFFDLASTVDEEAEWKVVLEDGTVLFGPIPLERKISVEARIPLLEFDSGWMLRELKEQNQTRMIGFTSLPWLSYLPMESQSNDGGRIATVPNWQPSRQLDRVIQGLNQFELWDPEPWEPAQRIFILVHEEAAEVLAPIRTQLLWITGTGVLFVLACFLVGLYLAQYHIIRPINILQEAARNIAASARLQRTGPGLSSHQEAALSPVTRDLLGQISQVKSEDELGELAQDFNSMARRVLTYHAHLESEISAKVTEIQGDLVIAREFQEALMPHEYPRIPDIASPDSLNLEFNHIYKPASTVGGDFFNVVKLSDHSAGIFIADVMGHGSRSALVTAIVATLLHDLAPKASDPAHFMANLNRHFHHLIQHSKQVIFVTAFYLVIDTRERRALFASAGHPSPLLIQRGRGRVKPLIHSMQNDTALGLLENSTYASFSRSIKDDDMFLLFTDGLFEAINPKGEEFGIQKLTEVVNRNMDFSASELSRRILDTVHRYSGFAAQIDDICLVTVEVNPPASPAGQTAGFGARGRKNQF